MPKTHYNKNNLPACNTLATFHSQPIITLDTSRVDCQRCIWRLNDSFPKGYDYTKAREKNAHLKHNSAASKKAATTKGAK